MNISAVMMTLVGIYMMEKEPSFTYNDLSNKVMANINVFQFGSPS